MADFLPAYEKTLLAEGGYILTNIKNDRGGQTYAGIARRANPNWEGWAYIDRGETPPAALVRSFYKIKYWDTFNGDLINNQELAESIYDFGVNAGVKTSIKLIQIILKVTPDGIIGPKSLEAINSHNPELLIAYFSIAKIARYATIVNKDRSQSKFLLGWINRTLKGH